MPGACFNRLLARERGGSGLSCLQLPRVFLDQEMEKLELCADKEVKSVHTGAVTCLSLDCSEERYLLSVGVDTMLVLYDTRDPLNNTAPGPRVVKPLIRRWKNRHEFAITCVQWYPFDTGLFITSGSDGCVKVWDTNEQKVIQDFHLETSAHTCHMSPLSLSHSLIATGTDSPHVRLCDIRSGSGTHSLLGHCAAVWSVQWCPGNEFLLASGSVDQCVRLWDIRRPGSLMVLDQMNIIDPFVNKRFISAHDRRRTDEVFSHGGAVTSLVFSPDSLHLLSSGSDRRVRLWDVTSGKNTLINFEGTLNGHKGVFPCFSPTGRFVLYPNLQDLCVYETMTGRCVKTLSGGHFERINACVLHPSFTELYTCSQDTNILVWQAPSAHSQSRMARDNSSNDIDNGNGNDNGDAWSESEEDGRQEEKAEQSDDDAIYLAQPDQGPINFSF